MKIFSSKKGKEWTVIEEPKKVGMLHKSAIVFGEGFKAQMKQPTTYEISAVAGLTVGLKYKGNLKAGLLTSGIVYTGWCALNGVANVVHAWDEMKNMDVYY